MAKKSKISKAAQQAGLRRQLDRETKKILQLKGAVASNFWDLGSALCRVHDRKLYRAKGHHSFEDYLQAEVKISRSNAYQLMSLAKNFSRETAIHYGRKKLLCAIDYAKATPEPDLPLDVTRYTIPARNRAGKKVEKTFKQASVRDLKRATANLRRKEKSQSPFPPLQLPSIESVLSGKPPEFQIDPFLTRAKAKLKDISPRPTVSVTITKKGKDPQFDLKLSGVRASTFMQAFGLLTAAACEAFLESTK